MHDNLTSRFITYDDTKETHIVYELPEVWWSRHYEYVWAGQFAEKEDTVLDVACGICHPFKFYLGTKAKEVFAFDQDTRILSQEEILTDIQLSIGQVEADQFDLSLFNNLHLAASDITSMPYADQSFNKLFCISVFEHLDEEVQLRALQEFSRVLKDDGLIVMTVDYPDVDIEKLMALMTLANLKLHSDYNFEIPDNAIRTNYWEQELRCIRLLLSKRE